MSPQIQPLAVSIAGAAELSSLSESTLDTAIRAGTLSVRRHGNRTVILVSALEQFLNSLPEGRPAAPSQFEGRRSGRPRNLHPSPVNNVNQKKEI